MSILYENFQDQSTIFDKLDNVYGGHVLIENYNDLLESQMNTCRIWHITYAKWLKPSMLIVVHILETE